MSVLGRILRLCLGAWAFALAWVALAQSPPKPPVDDAPRFEIRRFVFDGATLVPTDRLQAQTSEFLGPRRAFGDVQRALEAVERAYSEAGWSAVQVVLPEQELERGEIRFQIIEAKIGRVIVEGNKFFDEANIRDSVPALTPGSAPNINAIARNLRVANESPAKQAQVLLRSGQEEATVDAVLRVVDERPRKYSVTVDNSGSSQTGRLRVGLGFQNANTTGRDDVLSLQYVTAPYSDHLDEDGKPDHISLVPNRKVRIFGAGYRLPLYALGDSLDFSFGHSNVNSGTIADLFKITGAGTIYGVRYTKNLDRIGDYEHRLAYAADTRTYDNKRVRPVGSSTQITPDITVHPLAISYSGSYRKQDSETGFSVTFSRNLDGGNDGTAEDFCKFGLRNNGIGDCARSKYQIWRFSFNHNQAMPSDFQLRVAMQAQVTKDMLVPGELFGVGGADSVRGFLEREVADDKGYRATGEIYTPDFGGKSGLSGARARALVFYDLASLWRNHPGPAEPRKQGIGSWGIGLRFSQGTNMAFRIDYGVVRDGGGSREAGQGRFHSSFSYIF